MGSAMFPLHTLHGLLEECAISSLSKIMSWWPGLMSAIPPRLDSFQLTEEVKTNIFLELLGIKAGIRVVKEYHLGSLSS